MVDYFDFRRDLAYFHDTITTYNMETHTYMHKYIDLTQSNLYPLSKHSKTEKKGGYELTLVDGLVLVRRVKEISTYLSS